MSQVFSLVRIWLGVSYTQTVPTAHGTTMNIKPAGSIPLLL